MHNSLIDTFLYELLHVYFLSAVALKDTSQSVLLYQKMRTNLYMKVVHTECWDYYINVPVSVIVSTEAGRVI